MKLSFIKYPKKLTWPIDKTDTACIKLTWPMKNWHGLQTQLKLKHCKLKLKPHWLLLSSKTEENSSGNKQQVSFDNVITNLSSTVLLFWTVHKGLLVLRVDTYEQQMLIGVCTDTYVIYQSVLEK